MAGTGMREEAVNAVAELMKKNPDISMSEAQKGAGKKINVYPLIMGLARKKLGIMKSKPAKRGPGKRGPGRPPGSGVKRGAGRPRKVSSDTASMLEGVVGHVHQLEREVNSLRSAMAKISELAAGG